VQPNSDIQLAVLETLMREVRTDQTEIRSELKELSLRLRKLEGWRALVYGMGIASGAIVGWLMGK
jgi:hypothetical protein